MVVDAAMSSSRQLTLTQDRHRTRAISLYLAAHRDRIIANFVDEPLSADRNKKRKFMEHQARRLFRTMTEEEQREWMDRARAQHADGKGGKKRCQKQPLALATTVAARKTKGTEERRLDHTAHEESRRSGVAHEEFGRSGVQECIPARGASFGGTSLPTTPVHLMPPRSPRHADALQCSVAKRRHDDAVAASPCQPLAEYVSMRGRLGKVVPHMEKLFGDAGAAEVQAASLRILNAILPQLRGQMPSQAVTLAAVVGLAAKLTQTNAKPAQVKSLWAAVAGSCLDASVIALEPKVVNMWARQSLDSESWSGSVRALQQ